MNQPQTQIALAPAEQALRDEAFRTDARGALMPTNLRELMDYANMLADSSIVPKDFIGKPGNVLVAIQWGAELGLKPLQAMQNIAVINGRPSIWGDAMLALCMSHPEWAGIHEVIEEDFATVTVKRNQRTARGVIESVVTRTFTFEDAKVAGLAGKEGPWKTAKKRMMQMRARAFALRDSYTDVLKGFTTTEELRDMPLDVVSSATTIPEPTGAAAVKEKLQTKAQPAAPAAEPAKPAEAPAPTADLPSVDSWVQAFKSAETPDDVKAIRHELKDVWASYGDEAQNVIGKAIADINERFGIKKTR